MHALVQRILYIVLTAGAVAGCEREQRALQQPPSAARVAESAVDTPVQAGEPTARAPLPDTYGDNAYAMAQGKQFYDAYNCSGCHAQGGGDKGPALMDDVWIYGSDPANVFTSIVEGRPNGMPSFRGHIPEFQVWQLVAYVRSMSGLVSSDAAPGRNDAMQSKEPEQRVDRQPPHQSGEPAPAGKPP